MIMHVMFQFLPVVALLLIICTGGAHSDSKCTSIAFAGAHVAPQFSSHDEICSPLPCRVSGTVLRSDPIVRWFRADSVNVEYDLTGKWRDINSEYWQNQLIYPTRVTCKESSVEGVYNCDLPSYYCREEYTGLYQCRVTNTDDDCEIRRNVKYKRTILDDQDDQPECYMPMAVNLTIHTEELDNGTLSTHFSWDVTDKPSDMQHCTGARQWQVRYQTFDSVEDTPEDHEVVEAQSSLWQNTTTKRGTSFNFTSGINQTKYYMFQVKNEYKKRQQIFSSHVYFFGKQVDAILRTESKTVTLKPDTSTTISCEAEGFPTPHVKFLHQEQIGDLGHTSLHLPAVTKNEEGVYYCFGSNTVVNPPRGKKNIERIAVITVKVEEPDDSEIPCNTYDGSTCGPYIFGNIKVFVNQSKDSKQEIVKDAHDTIDELSSDPNNPSRCLEYAKALVCHSVFPYCDPNAISKLKYIPRPVCSKSCEVFISGECSGIIDPTSDLFTLLMSNCDASNRVAGDSPECIPVSMEAPSKDVLEHIEDTGSCYTGNGRGYSGDVTRTSTGLQCQTWSSQHPHIHPMTPQLFPTELGEGVGYACRNPGGLGERPWCYTTDQSVRWQYCDITECGKCEDYIGSFCEGITGFNTTAIHLSLQRLEGDQSHIELSIQGFYYKVTTDFENDGRQLTPGCDSALKLFLCHGSFPFCSPTGQEMKLCDHFCHLLSDMDACPGLREEIETYMNTVNSPLVDLDCDLLTETDESCQPSPIIMIFDSKELPETTLCYHDVGHTYQGHASVTESGIPCQRWDSDYPHSHNTKPDRYPELEGAENFCRNPGQWRVKPWCYTTNASVEWEYCDVASCGGTEFPPNRTGAVVISDGSNKEDILVGVLVTFAVLSIAILVVIVILVRCYCNRSHPKQSVIGDEVPTLSMYSGNSSEMKLVYNPQYVKHNVIPSKLASIIETFPQYDKSQIKYVKQLGQGNFGIVFQGKAEGILEDQETIVAVKTLKEESSSEALENFVHEAKLMFSFNHPNIIKIHGVCMHDFPYYMIFEYMDKGDLVQFLRASASSLQKRYLNPFSFRSRTESTLSSDSASLSTIQLIDICRQVSAGMEYLEVKKHVHRDLACRNCLLRSDQSQLTVKIGDFGMSQTLYTKDYYRVNGQAVLPVRWMSPEAVVYGKFSSAGDVWSFGIVMWEVFSFAMQPYYGISNEEVTEAIRRGRTLQKPHDCPPKIYAIMKDCWNMDAAARPSFVELHQILKDFRMSESSEDEMGVPFDQASHYSDTASELSSDAFYEENSVDGLSIDVEA